MSFSSSSVVVANLNVCVCCEWVYDKGGASEGWQEVGDATEMSKRGVRVCWGQEEEEEEEEEDSHEEEEEEEDSRVFSVVSKSTQLRDEWVYC